MEKILKAIGTGVALTGAVVLLVPISVLFGWITGLIIKLFCGTMIANGLNLIFNTNRFNPDCIPTMTATLSVLAGYMRTSTTVKND
jgi:hypothetical protein